MREWLYGSALGLISSSISVTRAAIGERSLRISVIAALNLADELFRARSAGAGLESQVLARTADIERLVDAVLGGAAASAIAAGQ